MYKNLAAVLAAACLFLSPPSFSQTRRKAPPLKVGFVYVAPITDAGWVHQHEEGAQGRRGRASAAR